jgi:hypothetical protein
MPKVSLPPSSARKKALALVDRGLIDQFMRIRHSLNMVSTWIDKKWKPLMKGSLSHFFCGRGFFSFLFEHKEDKDLIFCSDPYFFGEEGCILTNGPLNLVPRMMFLMLFKCGFGFRIFLSIVGVMMPSIVLRIILVDILIGLNQRITYYFVQGFASK